MPRSSRIKWISSVARRWRPSFSVLWKSRLKCGSVDFASTPRNNSAWAGSFSMSSTLTPEWDMVFSGRRDFHHAQPEIIEVPQRPHKFFHGHRFDDVAVHVQIIRLEDVFLRPRNRQYDHRKMFELRVAFNLREHFAPVLFRQ